VYGCYPIALPAESQSAIFFFQNPLLRFGYEMVTESRFA